MTSNSSSPHLNLAVHVWPVAAVAFFAIYTAILMMLIAGSGPDSGSCFMLGCALPQAAEAQPVGIDPGALEVRIVRDGKVFVGQYWIPNDQLREVLRNELTRRPEGGVLVGADRRLPFAAVAHVLSLLAELRPRSLSVVTLGSASILDLELARGRTGQPRPLVLTHQPGEFR